MRNRSAAPGSGLLAARLRNSLVGNTNVVSVVVEHRIVDHLAGEIHGAQATLRLFHRDPFRMQGDHTALELVEIGEIALEAAQDGVGPQSCRSMAGDDSLNRPMLGEG